MLWHIMCSLIFGTLYHLISKKVGTKLSLINSLYLGVSIQTNTGMNPVNLKDLGAPIQALMPLQMELGSFRFIAMLDLWKALVEMERLKVRRAATPVRTAADRFHTWHPNRNVQNIELGALSTAPDTAHRDTTSEPHVQDSVNIDDSRGSNGHSAYLSDWEREQLQDRECRSTRFLLYFTALVEITMIAAAGIVGMYNKITAESGLNAGWVRVYTMLSGYQNNGTNLLPLGIASFAEDSGTQIWLCVFMLVGNTCWPILLYILIWLMWLICRMMGRFSAVSYHPNDLVQSKYWANFVQCWTDKAEVLSFLLENPRRFYLLLYPKKQMIWLTVSILLLSLLNWVAFTQILFQVKDIQGFPTAQWNLIGLFQCLALRTTGYTIVGLSSMPAVYLVSRSTFEHVPSQH